MAWEQKGLVDTLGTKLGYSAELREKYPEEPGKWFIEPSAEGAASGGSGSMEPVVEATELSVAVQSDPIGEPDDGDSDSWGDWKASGEKGAEEGYAQDEWSDTWGEPKSRDETPVGAELGEGGYPHVPEERSDECGELAPGAHAGEKFGCQAELAYEAIMEESLATSQVVTPPSSPTRSPAGDGSIPAWKRSRNDVSLGPMPPVFPPPKGSVSQSFGKSE